MEGTLPPHYDLVGVGFGPSHLSLAALHDSMMGRAHGPRFCFLETRPAFAWHPDMLLDGARMQVAFAKDLVTPVDPTSRYTFMNYLVAKGRLEQFLNNGTLYPTRYEFVDYLTWVADQLAGYVSYNCKVQRIRPISVPDNGVKRVEVDFIDETDQVRTLSADNVSLAPGGKPIIPPGVAQRLIDSGIVFHSSQFRTRIARFHDMGRDQSYRFLVVGAGQSSAEIFLYLAAEFPAASVSMVYRSFALMPANNSALANEIFNPESVDLFYGSPDNQRREILADLRTTNYAAVDDADIKAIADLLYQQQVRGGSRLRLHRFTELIGCQDTLPQPSTILRDRRTGETSSHHFDGVVLATGYDFRSAGDLLTDLRPFLLRNPDGTLRVGRNYAAETTAAFQPKIFLHGAAEHTHGLTATLLSMVAHRAAGILTTQFSMPLRHPAVDFPYLQGVDV
jgi:L-ornithine N5-monooxygenase